MRVNRGVRWSVPWTGAAIVSTVLVAGCGASLVRGPSSIHPTGSFTTVALKCAGISIYPSPGSRTASAQTQIAFRNAPAARFDAQTVTVTGSETGVHLGRWVPDSDTHGASFYPSQPFQPGETVTVKTDLPICGTSGDVSHFEVARTPPASSGQSGPSKPQPPTPQSEVQHFQSAPQLQPPTFTVSKSDPSQSEGDFFLNPKGGTLPGGPMIVNGQGQLVWFDPLPPTVNSTDLKVQTLNGQPVLTWWQGRITQGLGYGEDIIMNSSYQVVEVVQAANGYAADLHEFRLGPNDTAWITAVGVVKANLRAVGGSKDGAAIDSVVQELDLRTGNVLFSWHSLDHIGLSLTEVPYGGPKAGPFDYFHANSIQPSGKGTVLISARNTDALYLVDIATGKVLWVLGGKDSTFQMGSGTRFALQHDARLHGQAVVTLFDDEDDKNGGPPARAIELRLSLDKRTATLVWAHHGPNNVVVNSQGSVQLLPDGHVVVGWGAGKWSPTTEITNSGAVLFQGTFPKGIDSYRAFRQSWVGQPTAAPAIAATSDAAGVKVFASWNGATTVVRWQVLGGPSATGLSPVGSRSANGFQTTIAVPAGTNFVEVEALGSSGQVLGTSAMTKVA